MPVDRPQDNPDDWKKWSRWDVPGHRTVYTADNRKAAYAEVLGWFKKHPENRPEASLDLSKYLDGIPDAEAGWDAVRQEWVNYMAPYQLPANWRHLRQMYEVRLPVEGWFADITTFQSMTAVSQTIGAQIAMMDSTDVDVSMMTSDKREVTCHIAEWIFGITLDDGHLAHGIAYPSRLGAGRCWAIWLRKVDDGASLDSEPTREIRSHPIQQDDADLNYVLQSYGLKCW